MILINKYITFIVDIIPYMIMALFGSVANLIISKKREDVYNIGFVLGKIFVAVFCSILIYLILSDQGVGGSYIAVACGVSGSMSERVLTSFQQKLSSKLESTGI